MGKIICDVCGAEYPDSEETCPVCGYSRDMADQPGQDDEILSDPYDVQQEPAVQQPPVQPEEMAQEEQVRKPIFDFDAVNPPDEEPEPYYDPELDAPQEPDGYMSYEDLGDDDENYGGYAAIGFEESQQPKQRVGLVIFLIVLNVLLLSATAFLFFKFLLPGKLSERPVPTIQTTQAAGTTETTAAAIPCTSLVMTSSGKVELNREGQFWLIHAKAMPEDTTDKIMYFSEDENVVTVSENGRVTAVGEGQTNVVMICGRQQLACPVTVVWKDITEPLETGEILMPTSPETVETTQATEAAEAAETKAAEARETEAPETVAPTTEATTRPIDPSIELKLKKTDILFKGLGLSTTLELDCELDPEDVEWTSANQKIVLVDEKGKVTTLNYGATKVTAKYGDQEVSCVVRCVQNEG